MLTGGLKKKKSPLNRTKVNQKNKITSIWYPISICIHRLKYMTMTVQDVHLQTA